MKVKTASNTMDANPHRSDRRQFLQHASLSLGGVALAELLGAERALSSEAPPIVPKAKRVIYLFQSGGPPQHETFDYKPMLHKVQGP